MLVISVKVVFAPCVHQQNAAIGRLPFSLEKPRCMTGWTAALVARNLQNAETIPSHQVMSIDRNSGWFSNNIFQAIVATQSSDWYKDPR
jgi:hypothetical protein